MMKMTLTLLMIILAIFGYSQREVGLANSIMTLKIGDNRQIKNPSDEQLRTELSILDSNGDDSFAVLGPSDMTYIQLSGDKTVGFDMEYQEDSPDAHYRAVAESISPDQAIQTFIGYHDGNESWKDGFVLEKMNF